MIPAQYMESVLEKARIDVKAKAFEWCDNGVQVEIKLNKDEIDFLLWAIDKAQYPPLTEELVKERNKDVG